MTDNKDNTRTEIATLGEFGLIKHLTKNIEFYNASTILGVGDDAAIIQNLKKNIVVSSDLLLEGIHFDLSYTPLKHLGYKSVIVNLSDIYAMNCTPTQIVVNIGISNKFSLEALEEFYEGIYLACKNYQVDLVGGDTSSSLKGFTISITAIGEGDDHKIVKRHTAQTNDLICVSGDLGAAYLGLLLLEREKKIFLDNPNITPDLEDQTYIIGRLLKPEARKEIINFLETEKIIPTAMIDVSDGLSSELKHICQQSKLGCTIYEDKLPIHPNSRNFAYKLQVDPSTCALNGGEDYELLFTISQKDYEKIKIYPHISVIGHMHQDLKQILISKAGKIHSIVAQGWTALG